MPPDPAIPPTPDVQSRLVERLAAVERRLAALEAREGVPVVDALPAAGRRGRLVYLTTDGKVYKDTGSAWANPL